MFYYGYRSGLYVVRDFKALYFPFTGYFILCIHFQIDTSVRPTFGMDVKALSRVCLKWTENQRYAHSSYGTTEFIQWYP